MLMECQLNGLMKLDESCNYQYYIIFNMHKLRETTEPLNQVSHNFRNTGYFWIWSPILEKKRPQDSDALTHNNSTQTLMQ